MFVYLCLLIITEKQQKVLLKVQIPVKNAAQDLDLAKTQSLFQLASKSVGLRRDPLDRRKFTNYQKWQQNTRIKVPQLEITSKQKIIEKKLCNIHTIWQLGYILTNLELNRCSHHTIWVS